MTRIEGAVTLITGASGGIGAALAGALVGRGARLLLSGTDADALKAVAAETGGIALPADLLYPSGCARLARAALAETGGRIDLLISNAGTGWAGPVSAIPVAKVDELIGVNLAAPVYLTRLLVPHIPPAGRIVFVSSIAGAVGVPGEAVYSAAKAGLACFAESLRRELRPGPGVTVVYPGAVDTGFFKRRGAPYDRTRPPLIPPERVADAIVRAVTRGQDRVYVPGSLRFAAWLHGAAPRVFAAGVDRDQRRQERRHRRPEQARQGAA